VRVLFPYLVAARKAVQACGPYLLLELLLPGGTMFALLLFLYRRKGSKLAAFAHRVLQLGNAGPARRIVRRVMLPLDAYAWAEGTERTCGRARDGLEAFAIVPGCTPMRPKSEVIAVHW
jgi:hypothetical protein